MNFGEEKAIYLQIKDHICELILSGRWPAGGRIVSVREMAADLEVNPNTVMRSYNELADAEILTNKRGVGFFISEQAPELIREEQKQQFLKDDLPKVFKKMQLLGITVQELNDIYQSNQKQQL